MKSVREYGVCPVCDGTRRQIAPAEMLSGDYESIGSPILTLLPLSRVHLWCECVSGENVLCI